MAGGALLGVMEIVNAVVEVVHFPFWTLTIYMPVLAAAVVSTQTSSIRRTVIVGTGTAVLFGVTVGLVSTLSGSADPHRHAGPRHALPPTLWRVQRIGYAVDQLANDGTDLWAVAGTTSVLDVDGASLSRLGGIRRFGGVIERVLACSGEVLVTYGDGRLAEFPDAGIAPAKSVIYGHPVYDGQLTGTMVCGDGSLYLAMPREAEILRFALPSLRLLARIRDAARLVSGLAYSHSTLYVQDASQTAVIAVRNDVPLRWTITGPQPDKILAMDSAGAILTHQDSRCLGYLAAGFHQEIGFDWSTYAPVRAAAVAGAQGVVLDSAGWLYRFNSVTGTEDAAPLRPPFGEYATSVAIMTGGRTVLTIPEADELASVSPQAWQPLRGSTEPAAGCLEPSE